MNKAHAFRRTSMVLAAALAACQLAILGPLGVWADNRDSFDGLSGASLLTLLAALLALTALFLLPGLLVPRFAKPLSAALFASTLLMWGQSFLSGRLLTGIDIAGSVSRAKLLGELAAWAAVLVAALVLSARLLKPLARAAVLVIVVQSLTLGWTVSRAEPRNSRLSSNQQQEQNHLAALSRSRNIIVLILDAMHRDYATRALVDNRELAESFAGFRVFTDHLATFPTTRFSIPAMLSGKNYDNSEPAETFIHSTLAEGDSAPRRLQNSGWDVGLATFVRSTLVAPADTRVAVAAYVRKRQSAQVLGLELLDLSAFRHAPTRLGMWVYNADRWRFRQFADAARRNYGAVLGLDFITDYVGRLRVSTSKPVFRFIHTGGAHPPVVVGSDCSLLGVQELTAATYAEQVECALSQAAALVDRLRELGILDQTAFIVASDHGISVKSEVRGNDDPFTWILDRAAATMMVKPFGGSGPVVFDPTPTSNQDLPTIVARLASEGLTESGYLPADARPGRRRSFVFHAWRDSDWRESYVRALHTFRVGPGAASKSAWSYVGTIPSPELGAREQAQLREDALAYFPHDDQ